MLLQLAVRLWSPFWLKELKLGEKVLVMLPLEKCVILSPFIPETEFQRVHLDLCRGRESIRIGQLDVFLKKNQITPVGRVTPDMWAYDITGGYEEEFIRGVAKEYDIPEFNRFSLVQIIVGKVIFLEKVFYENFS